MVRFYLRLSILLFTLSFINITTQAADNKPGHGRKAEAKSTKTTAVKKPAVPFKGVDGTSENIGSLQTHVYDVASAGFIQILLNDIEAKKLNNMESFDPVRFRLIADEDSIVIGKEIELKIIAEFLDVNPQLVFTFEGANEYTLKTLLPRGFVVTGGTYYDYITDKRKIWQIQIFC